MFRNLSLGISYRISIHTFRKGCYEVIKISRYYTVYALCLKVSRCSQPVSMYVKNKCRHVWYIWKDAGL